MFHIFTFPVNTAREVATMSKTTVPSKLYNEINSRFPDIFKAHEELGSALKKAGPLSKKNIHLIQLAAAGAIQSEGSVHSHTRRAIKAGATEEEIYHTLISLISTIGFPRTMAALSWARDIIH